MSITNITENLNKPKRFLARVINAKEGDNGLSHARFTQSVSTNLGAALPFTRSAADASEKIFLELFEGIIFCYLSVIAGNTLVKNKLFAKSTPTAKAALVLGCTIVPAAGYALSYAKNLFTLKVFKKADFSNVVNLDKNKKEDPEHQRKVEKNAKSSIANAAIAAAAGLAAGAALASFGHKSLKIEKASEIFLNPGKKLYEHLEKHGTKVSNGVKSFLDSYGSLDFRKASDGTLGLGKGQLALTVSTAVCGYFGAAKDRGKLDFLEVATRVPLIALYTIFGSELLDGGLKKYLHNRGKCPAIVTKGEDGLLKVAALDDLTQIAKNMSGDYKTNINKVFKDKAAIAMVPWLFSMLVIGSFITLMCRIWTKKRYNSGIGNANFAHVASWAPVPRTMSEYAAHCARQV